MRSARRASDVRYCISWTAKVRKRDKAVSFTAQKFASGCQSGVAAKIFLRCCPGAVRAAVPRSAAGRGQQRRPRERESRSEQREVNAAAAPGALLEVGFEGKLCGFSAFVQVFPGREQGGGFVLYGRECSLLWQRSEVPAV